MNILFITFWYPSKNNPHKGIFIKEHAKSIALLNNVVVFNVNIEKSKNILKQEIKIDNTKNNIYTIELAISSKFYKFIYYFSPLINNIFYKKLKKNLPKNFRPNIIHGNVVYPAGILSNYISKKLNIPFVISEHWSNSANFLKKHTFKKAGINAYNNALKIFPVSNFLRNKIKIFIKDENKITIIPNVVNNNIFNYKQKKTNPDTFNFICIATWEKNKNFVKRPDLIIQSLHEFQKDTNKKIILNIVGNGNLIDNIKEETKRLNIEAKFYGFLQKKELAELFQKMDYLIHATNIETFSLVVAESLMSGTPVIASNVGAIPELLTKSSGILVKNNINDWVKGLKILTTTKFDNERIHLNFKEKFSHKIISNQFTEAYKKITVVR